MKFHPNPAGMFLCDLSLPPFILSPEWMINESQNLSLLIFSLPENHISIELLFLYQIIHILVKENTLVRRYKRIPVNLLLPFRRALCRVVYIFGPGFFRHRREFPLRVFPLLVHVLLVLPAHRRHRLRSHRRDKLALRHS